MLLPLVQPTAAAEQLLFFSSCQQQQLIGRAAAVAAGGGQAAAASAGLRGRLAAGEDPPGPACRVLREGSGDRGCSGREEPASRATSRARDASRATRRRRPSRWSPWRSSLSWAAGQLASVRPAGQLASVRAAHVCSGGATAGGRRRRWASAQVGGVARSFYGGCRRWLRRPVGRRRKKQR